MRNNKKEKMHEIQNEVKDSSKRKKEKEKKGEAARRHDEREELSRKRGGRMRIGNKKEWKEEERQVNKENTRAKEPAKDKKKKIIKDMEEK